MSFTEVIVWFAVIAFFLWFIRNRWRAWCKSRAPLRSTYTAIQMNDSGGGTGAVVNKLEVVAYTTSEAREIAAKEFGPLPEHHSIVIRETHDYDVYERFG